MSSCGANSNFTYLAFEEGAGITNPLTASGFKVAKTEVSGFQPTQESTRSNNIRSDRQLSELVKVQETFGGSFTSEIQYSALDSVNKGVFFNNIVAGEVLTGVECTFNNTAKTINISGPGFTVAPAGGQWVKVHAGDNAGYYLVVSATTTVLTLASWSVLTDETATVTISKSKTIRNGVTSKPLTAVKGHVDVDQYFLLHNLLVNTAEWSFEQGSIPTVTYELLGGFGEQQETDPATLAQAESTQPFINPTDNIKSLGIILSNGTLLPSSLLVNFSLNINNNLQEIPFLGTDPVCISPGSIEVTGSFTMALQNATIYNEFKNSSNNRLFFRIEDNNGNTIVFTVYSLKWDDVTADISGINEPVNLEGSFAAAVDPVIGTTVGIDMFDA